jgi:hypothetical protein
LFSLIVSPLTRLSGQVKTGMGGVLPQKIGDRTEAQSQIKDGNAYFS